MGNKIAFWVNGEQVFAAEPDPRLTLLDFLRDALRLRGSKNGCGTGHCGACTVIIDGEARRACQVRTARMEGRRVETIENLARDGELHPIQTAFVKTGAIQCGFCTPGMIMSAKALLDRNSDPSIEDIRKAFAHNLCRCTGYVKIVEAVKLAAREMHHGSAAIAASTLSPGPAGIGRSIPDYDYRAKVRGEPIFAADLEREGMVFGKVLWSKFPHARIRHIDTGKARGLSGVRAVLTHEDIPGDKCFGRIKADNPILCSDRVRFLGDAIALVFADTVGKAKQAAELIDVDYEELPVVSSPAEALADGAPRLHEEGNVCKKMCHEIGNVDEARKGSSVVVSGHFETGAVDPGYLEPDAGIALFENGVLTIYFPTQSPFHTRQQVAGSLNLPRRVGPGGRDAARRRPRGKDGLGVRVPSRPRRLHAGGTGKDRPRQGRDAAGGHQETSLPDGLRGRRRQRRQAALRESEPYCRRGPLHLA